jgi:oligopeptide/dipeptide ABC transporter ATP-binding protein
MAESPIVEMRGVHRVFRTPRGPLRALDGVDLDIYAGESVALVGETGSGKSTLARLLLGLIAPTGGSVVLWGRELADYRGRELKSLRQKLGVVFQDPFSSLNPRLSVGRIVEEPLAIHGVSAAGRRARVRELLEAVGLDPSFAKRRPPVLSGGQRQRVAIARAIALEPELLVLDEPVSALDVSIQAQVLNLLADLHERLGFTSLIISHDLAVVRHVGERVAVMYLGRIVEIGDVADLFGHPQHPYTLALLSSAMDLDVTNADRILLAGDPPSPISPPSGCRFRTRCFRAQARCGQEDPGLHPVNGAAVACFFPGGFGTWPSDSGAIRTRLKQQGGGQR